MTKETGEQLLYAFDMDKPTSPHSFWDRCDDEEYVKGLLEDPTQLFAADGLTIKGGTVGYSLKDRIAANAPEHSIKHRNAKLIFSILENADKNLRKPAEQIAAFDSRVRQKMNVRSFRTHVFGKNWARGYGSVHETFAGLFGVHVLLAFLIALSSLIYTLGGRPTNVGGVVPEMSATLQLSVDGTATITRSEYFMNDRALLAMWFAIEWAAFELFDMVARPTNRNSLYFVGLVMGPFMQAWLNRQGKGEVMRGACEFPGEALHPAMTSVLRATRGAGKLAAKDFSKIWDSLDSKLPPPPSRAPAARPARRARPKHTRTHTRHRHHCHPSPSPTPYSTTQPPFRKRIRTTALTRTDALAPPQIADLTFKKSEAEACLSQGLFEEAIPGAQQALQLSIDLYGKESIDVVPCYLLLAEANLGALPCGWAIISCLLSRLLGYHQDQRLAAVVAFRAATAWSGRVVPFSSELGSG
eukprot:SAG31_NODE_1999_length_6695_cov_2.926774_5_plen_470_part_00